MGSINKPTGDDPFAALRARAEQEAEKRPAQNLAQFEFERLLHELRVHQVELEMQNEELRESRAETEAALERYAQLYDYAPVGYFTLAREDGAIRQTNLAGAALLNSDRRQLLGRRFGVFVDDSQRRIFNAFLSGVVNSQVKTSCELRVGNPQHTRPPRFVRIEAVTDRSAENINAVVLDITEKKQHEAELASHRKHLEELLSETAAAREAAETASSAKSQFLANTSHELRNPLNSMLIMAQLLAENPDGNYSEKQRGYARLIGESGADLLYLIDQLLDLARIEAGKLGVAFKPIILRKELRQVERGMRELAAKKGLEFSVQIDQDVPTRMFTDHARLQQVLRNLLSNAIKFTAQGKVLLHVRNVPAYNIDGEPGETRHMVAFDVCDTGIGIAAENQARIFEVFEQADSSTNRAFGGAGLGLPIAKQIAGLLGGGIALLSTPGQGSTFTLYLPVDQPVARKEQADVATPKAPGMQKRVLVVDDIARNRFALGALLEDRGIEVTTAGARQAIEHLQRDPVDLVLLGASKASSKTLEWIRALRTQKAFARLPVIALLDDVKGGNKAAYLTAGFSECMTMPLGHEDLTALVDVWLRGAPAPAQP